MFTVAYGLSTAQKSKWYGCTKDIISIPAHGVRETSLFFLLPQS